MSLKTRVEKAEAQARPQLLEAEFDKIFAAAVAQRKAGQRSEFAALSDEELIAKCRDMLMQRTPEEQVAILRVLRRRGYWRDAQGAA